MKYRVLLLAGAALQVGVVQAMGLGNMHVESYLGVPLQARIDLLVEPGVAASELTLSQADADVYARFGARDLVDHGRLQFEVYENEQGRLSARVISAKRIVEPYIDLVVELRWPRGVTYREYPVLLDLPTPANPPARPVKAVTHRTQPQDEIKALKAELLRLQRERSALLARKQAIHAELQELKAVQQRLAEQETTRLPPEHLPAAMLATAAVETPVVAVPELAPQLHSMPDLAAVDARLIPVPAVPVPFSEPANIHAQDLIFSGQPSTGKAKSGAGRGIGFWSLIALMPLLFALVFCLLRVRLVDRVKGANGVKDEDLYELVFGGRRDRSRVENKAQVGKALQQIQSKASLHQLSTAKPATVLVQEEDAVDLDLQALLSSVSLPPEDAWMVQAPIRKLAR